MKRARPPRCLPISVGARPRRRPGIRSRLIHSRLHEVQRAATGRSRALRGQLPRRRSSSTTRTAAPRPRKCPARRVTLCPGARTTVAPTQLDDFVRKRAARAGEAVSKSGSRPPRGRQVVLASFPGETVTSPIVTASRPASLLSARRHAVADTSPTSKLRRLRSRRRPPSFNESRPFSVLVVWICSGPV